jgi:rubrerythrin
MSEQGKGVFIGAYIPPELKAALQERAWLNHRTLSQEIALLLDESARRPTLPSTHRQLHCLRCGHQWTPRVEGEPQNCPACNSPYWNRERKRA